MKLATMFVRGAFAALLIASPAMSTTKAASGGAAYYPADTQCFSREYGRIRAVWDGGNCNSQKYWTVDVEMTQPTTTGNTKPFWVVGESETSVITSTWATTCAGIVLYANGTLARWTGHQVLPTTVNFKNLGSLTVNANESLQYECLISPFSSGPSGYVSQVNGVW